MTWYAKSTYLNNERTCWTNFGRTRYAARLKDGR